ncbi:MAG: polysaccharide biosynthesis C-terminal domain-containing protein [bacterium]|nr:polysaccharide biosynthesis C-terminal domain-containing protein [bacterium]
MRKNILYSLFTKSFVAGVNFLILLISSRYLGVSSRGEISIFLLNIALVQVVNEIYTGYSIVHFVPKFDLKKIVLSGLFYTVMFCTLSNLLITAVSKHVPGYEKLAYLVSLMVLLNTFFCVLILSKQNIKLYSLLSFLQPLTLLLGLLFSIFFLKEFTIKAYILPLFFSFLLALCISAITIVNYVLAEAPGKVFQARPILWNGLIYQLGLLLYLFINKFSFYLLPTAAKVGLYSAACSLMESVLILASGIGPVLLARVANEPRSNKNIRLTLGLSKFILLVSLLSVGILLVIPEKAFLVVLGNGFTGIKTSMSAYAPGVVMAGIFLTLANYLNAMGQQRTVLICYGAGALSSLILAPVLVAKYDVLGAAYTANFSYFVITVLMGIAFAFYGNVTAKSLFSPIEYYADMRELMSGFKRSPNS